jgi:uncharacterized protein YkwD
MSSRIIGLTLLILLIGCNRTGSTPKPNPNTPNKPASSTTATPTTTPTTTPTATPIATPTVGHENSDPNTLSSEAQLALKLINQARATGRTCKDDKLNEGFFAAAKPVAWNLKLEASAHNHSSDMRQKNYFAHASPSGVTLQKRLEKVGYIWRMIGENIAAGQPTLERAVEGWIGSAGHCAVLMNAEFTQMGLGRVDGTNENTYKVYWTLDFGTPR